MSDMTALTPDQLRAMGLYRTAEFGQTINTRVSQAGSCRAFSGSPIQLIDDADAMRAELLARVRELAGERDEYRSCIAANMAGCDVPTRVTGDLTDTGDCSKCHLSEHCNEYRVIAAHPQQEAPDGQH